MPGYQNLFSSNITLVSQYFPTEPFVFMTCGTHLLPQTLIFLVCLSLTLNRSLELFPKVLSAVAAKDSIPMVGGKKINFLNKWNKYFFYKLGPFGKNQSTPLKKAPLC